jgi:hypothetical protein
MINAFSRLITHFRSSQLREEKSERNPISDPVTARVLIFILGNKVPIIYLVITPGKINI